jgi:hypothetical protein
MTRSWWQAAGLAVLLAGLAALGWQAAGGAAEDKPSTETLPPDLARVPAKSLALISVRAADVWSGALAKGVRSKLGKEFAAVVKETEKETGLTPDDVERMTMVMVRTPDDHPLIFFATTKAFDKKKVFGYAVVGGEEEKYKGETLFANNNMAGLVLGEKAFVIGSKGEVQSLIDAGKGKPEGGLAPALALAAGKHSLVVGVNPGALPPLPEELPPPIEPFKPLVKASVATLAVDLGEKTTGTLRITFPGGGEAGAGLKAVETGRKLALGILDQGIGVLSKDEKDKTSQAVARLVEIAQKSLKSATIKRDGNTIVGHLDMKIDETTTGTIIAEGVRKVREAAARTQSQNNLKQIALAMFNYHDKNGRFPAQAIYDKDGKPLLSWRVMLLPYLDQNNLYNKFKLDEAWDSPNNKKLLAVIPKTYMAPAGKPKHPHGTFYQGFYGKGAFFEGKKGVGIADITDGTSNTIMVVEAPKDVPWTKPEDILFDPDKPLPKMTSMYSSGIFSAALCDGSVRGISPAITKATLKAAITRNGGEVLGADW